MSTGRKVARVARVSARVLVGAAVSAVAVIAVVVAIAAPWPTITTEPARVEAVPAATDTVLSCAGPVLAVGRQVQQARELSLAATEQLVSGAVGGRTVSETSRLTEPGLLDGGATVLRAAPVAGVAATFGGATSAGLDAEDLRGFAAAACQPPLMESWLVGGSTATGSADLVVLANPGDVAATVDLTVFGAGAPLVPPGGTGVVVPARAERVIPLAGLLRGEENPAVRVTASGAPVRATLQTSLTRTLIPGGVDQVGAVAVAAEVQIVPGIRVTAPVDAGAADVTASVRVLSPADDATASVRITAAGGAEVSVQDVALKAGVPTALDLSGMPAGTYTAEVRATAPVVASAWAATGIGAGSDFAWFVAAPAIADEAQISVAAGPTPTLTVANPGDTVATVRLSTDGAPDVTIAVPPRFSVETSVVAGATYRLTSDLPVRAAVGFVGEGRLASYTVWPGDAAAPKLVVYP